MQDVRQVEHPADAHEPGRGHHAVRGDLVERAGLVVGTVAGREPGVHSDDQLVSKLGNSVRPPSTNRVCPVMYDGLVGAEERHRGGHLTRVPCAAHRDVRLDRRPLDRIVDPGAVDRRDRGARTHAVHPDPPRRVLQRERVGQVLHAALGHRVADEPRLRDDLVHAGDVDDAAPAVGGQPIPDGPLRAEERPAQVHREHPVEVGDSEIVRVAGDLDPRVVDQDVDAAVLLHHLVEHRVDLPGVGHVRGDQDRLRARRRQLTHAQVHPVLDGVARLLGALRAADVVDGDVDALLTQPDGDRLPDARAAPGDQCLLALQTLHGFSP